MQGGGVRYHIKHSGQFLYKISNEENFDKFKVTKIKMPHEIKENLKQIEASPIVSKTESSEL